MSIFLEAKTAAVDAQISSTDWGGPAVHHVRMIYSEGDQGLLCEDV